jgi:acetyltransferase-like isoleucine patch superfamily enzyme
MIRRVKYFIKRLIFYLCHPYKLFGWLYSAYLTLRYVDDYNCFPAFQFSKRIIRLRITKGKNSYFSLGGRIIVSPWLDNFASEIKINDQANLKISNDFIIGDDVHIKLSSYASAEFVGKKHESGSGITARSLVLVAKQLLIGADVIIAWDTFITDSDWHQIGGIQHSEKTVIGDHVWLANGVKVLRGSIIGENSIVACGAVVTGGSFPAKSLIGGIPAKLIRSDIPDWHR